MKVIKDEEIEVASHKASDMVYSGKNITLIAEAVDAVTKLARETSALRNMVEIQEDSIKTMRKEFRKTLNRYKITYIVFICVILLLLGV